MRPTSRSWESNIAGRSELRRVDHVGAQAGGGNRARRVIDARHGRLNRPVAHGAIDLLSHLGRRPFAALEGRDDQAVALLQLNPEGHVCLR